MGEPGRESEVWTGRIDRNSVREHGGWTHVCGQSQHIALGRRIGCGQTTVRGEVEEPRYYQQ